jgi:hypothetical protein
MKRHHEERNFDMEKDVMSQSDLVVAWDLEEIISPSTIEPSTK